VHRRLACVVLGSVVASAIAVTPVQAQLNTQHLKGGVGLKAGSQPPPHLYVLAPLIFVYNTDTVKTADGTELPFHPNISSVAYGAGIVDVTTVKILGGFYGFQVLFPFGVNNRIQGTEIDANPGAGLTDTVIQPISLGWHLKQADATAGYNIFVPTGRYTNGASNNTGLGMWGNELFVGTTVYLNEAKQYHVATIASFDFQSKKKDSETKVGNTMILEGGVGADFLKGGLTAGLDYYAGFKLSDDQIQGFPSNLPIGKNKSFALGPEVSMALARKGVLYGFLKVNYEWEVYARTTTQGNMFSLALTFAVKPIKLPGAP
jgi:hypothetical protein